MKLLEVFQGTNKEIPCWFMRQAGRYLPEYQDLRKKCPDFIKFCLSPEKTTLATLQPIERYKLDAAIIFSDILMIPYAVGQKVWFEPSHGPRLDPYKEGDSLDWGGGWEVLSPVYESITQVRSALPKEVALIGFAGAPYTLACYMIEGQTSRTFSKAKSGAFQNPKAFEQLLEKLTHEIIQHLRNQIDAGCEVIQVFESWASTVPASHVKPWLITPLQKIVKSLKQSHPHVPLISFPKDLGTWIPQYVQETGVDGISLSSAENIEALLPQIDSNVVLQGALDPQCLVAGGEQMEQEIHRLVTHMRGRRYIFNLGHGIVPETPPENVTHAIQTLRKAESQNVAFCA